MLGRLFESRSLSYQSVWGSGRDMLEGSTLAGTRVGADNALKISAVYACVRLYVDTVSTLPADSFIRIDGDRRPYRPKPAWIDEPSPGVSRADHVAQVMLSLLIDGNAFIHVLRNGIGDVVNLSVLDPTKVEITRADGGELVYLVDYNRRLPESDVLHITEMRRPGQVRGVSRIEQVKETLGLAKALEEFAARFFSQGSITSGVIEHPGSLTEDQARQLVDGFEQHHRGLRRAHRPGVLAGGAKFNKTGVDPEQAQMIQSRQMAVEDVARIFRIPAHMLGVTTPGAMSYASVEQNAIQWVRFSVVPIVAKLEATYSRLLPSTAFVKFNLDSLLRGDTQTRFSAYSTGLQSGFMSINDIRRLEDMRPVDGGDVVRVPLANVDINAAGLVEMDKRVSMARNLIQVGFDPAATMAALSLPMIDHTGVPSTQLQPIALLNPADPSAAY